LKEVERQTEVYRPLPNELVKPLAYPESLPERFTIEDTFDLIYGLYDSLDLANDDRARAGRIVDGTEELEL
jgi:hypothetical protein